jgi:hypothetical protein
VTAAAFAFNNALMLHCLVVGSAVEQSALAVDAPKGRQITGSASDSLDDQ